MATRTKPAKAKPHISEAAPVSPYVLELAELFDRPMAEPVAAFALGDLLVAVHQGRTSLWAIIRRPGKGGLAIRAAFLTGQYKCKHVAREGAVVRLELTSRMGFHEIAFVALEGQLHRLRMTVRFTPAVAMVVPFLPRDLYPLGEEDDPLGAKGHVEAAQRGLNSGVIYFRIDQPAFGTVLYLQNLTALNDYFIATNTKPDAAVGGEWPELGYLPPTPPQSGTPPVDPLPAGKTVTLSDAILVFRDDGAPSEAESARRFLQMLGSAYTALDLPEPVYHDWIERAEHTLKDLETAPEATIRHYGHVYIHPYTASEYPDIMVQMSLIAAIRDWGAWRGEPHPLQKVLTAGLGKFYDTKLKTLRRYLPNVGDDKDADAVDSWYLYHPLLNLARLAIEGDARARVLFLKSVDYGIKAAHHFDYRWPIQYKITDFSIITATANDDRGQTDVGGLYAYVMLQAYELTTEERFLHEARAAIDIAIGMRFNLNYQANLTAWGAAACMRLWRITNADQYRGQSYVYLASFFHNCQLWKSEIGFARHYTNFLGVSALQDSPYMALYECFDSFSAFERYLEDGGPDLEPAARMLVTEYCKYAVDRAWYFYPDALPAEALATENRNGHIDRKLSFPLEDLYADGQPAGQVGQEIYGAGAAMVFASRMFHTIDGAPFRLFCNHFIRVIERTGDRVLSLQLEGGERCVAALNVLRLKRRRLPKISVRTIGGDIMRPRRHGDDRIEFIVPADGRVILSWEKT